MSALIKPRHAVSRMHPRSRCWTQGSWPSLGPLSPTPFHYTSALYSRSASPWFATILLLQHCSRRSLFLSCFCVAALFQVLTACLACVQSFAESTMNELLGWYGYDKVELRDSDSLEIGETPQHISVLKGMETPGDAAVQ